MAVTWFKRLLSVALLPEPVGPNRNRCAFLCRSRRLSGSKVDSVYGEAQELGESAEQAEAVAGFHDEEARPVDGRDLVQEVVECGALTGAGGTEQEQMRVHLPVQAVERVEGDRPTTAVEHRDAGVPRTLGAAPHRRQEIGRAHV